MHLQSLSFVCTLSLPAYVFKQTVKCLVFVKSAGPVCNHLHFNSINTLRTFFFVNVDFEFLTQ